MQTHETSLFTPNEAAVLTGLPVKAVHNAIDRKTISAVTGKRGGHATRLLDRRALISLALERRLGNRFVPETRREVFEALGSSSRNVVSLEGGMIRIDLREPRRELAASLRDLRRARQLIHSDPEIMGGDPVFRGTRVPVHMIADIRAQGESDEDLLEDYPRITLEMIRLAPIYAAAYPLQGRPRKHPWHDRPPVSVTYVKLADIEVVPAPQL
jgi:uncharacterized protein (DUF433 family)